ncbi:MAG: glycosyltransferase, partial [Tannerellaceae bacterium]|nr:glycosyltransferase [Tannerellaceae bacterium]
MCLLQLHIEDKKDVIFHLNYNYDSNFPKELKDAFDCRIVTSIHYLDWCLKTNGNVSVFRKKLAASEKESVNDIQKTIYESYLKEFSFFEAVDYIICLSEYTRNILRYDYRISTDKIGVVYNGLTDVKLYYNKLTLRMKYHIPDIPILLFTGRVRKLR